MLIQVLTVAGLLMLLAGLGFAAEGSASRPAKLPMGAGLAANYPGDKGIEQDPAVVFVETFDETSLEETARNWSSVKNAEAMSLTGDLPPGSPGGKSLKITATRGRNDGGHLFKVFKPGYEQLYARFYVKFSKDHGFLHHFVKLQGAIDPPPYPMGGAGSRPTTSWTTGIEPTRLLKNKYPATEFGPPGIWHFYSYWPEMRSYETPEGIGTRFYGNYFAPIKPYVAPRNEWTCVEFMVRLNDVGKPNGGQAFWIDGELAGNFMPGAVKGYWMRDTFRNDPGDERSKPFEGIRWRKDPRVTINKFWFLYYMSESAFKTTEEHASDIADSRENTVWFDHVVVATEYIGPLAK